VLHLNSKIKEFFIYNGKSILISLYVCLSVFNFNFDVSYIALVALVLYEITEKSSLPAKNNTFFLFLALYITAIFFSSNFTQSVALSIVFITGIILYISVRRVGSDIRCLILIPLTLILTSGYFLVTGELHKDFIPQEIVDSFKNYIFIVPNDLVIVLIAAPFICMYKNIRPYMLILLIIYFLYLANVMQSRLCLLVLISILAYIFFKYLNIRKSALIFFPILAAMIFIFDSEFINKLASFNDARLPLWISAGKMFLDKPIMGFGPHTFGIYYQNYHSEFNLMDIVVLDTRISPWPHNLYLELLSEGGVILLFSFLALTISNLKKIIRNVHKEREFAYPDAMLCSFGAFLIAAFFEASFIRMWVVFYFFIIQGLIDNLEIQHG